MGWSNDACPGHEGYLIGLERMTNSRGSEVFRALVYPDDDQREALQLGYVQVGCCCGWKSQVRHAPLGTEWYPFVVCLPKHEQESESLHPAIAQLHSATRSRLRFEDWARQLWREHATSATREGLPVLP